MIGQTKLCRLLIGYIPVKARNFRVWINEQSDAEPYRSLHARRGWALLLHDLTATIPIVFIFVPDPVGSKHALDDSREGADDQITFGLAT